MDSSGSFPNESRPTSPSLGQVVRQRRLQLGLSQEQLAAAISATGDYVRQADISNLERGRVQLPRRPRLERIAAALDLSLGQLLAQAGWAEADRYLASALLNVPPFTAGEEPSRREPETERRYWWQDGAEAVRIITARLAHDRFDQVIDGYRNAVLWMATADEGFRGCLLLLNRTEREVVSLGFWQTHAAMANSTSTIYLPQQVVRLDGQLVEPPSIEFHTVIERAAPDPESRKGRHAQIDRAAFPTNGGSAVEQFRRHVEQARQRPPYLDRAALLTDAVSGRVAAVGLWEESDDDAHRERGDAAPREVMFPQLVQPATSRHYEVVLEI